MGASQRCGSTWAVFGANWSRGHKPAPNAARECLGDHYYSLVSLLEAVASGVCVCMCVSEKCVRVGVCGYVCVRACGVCACACGV